MKTYPIPFSPPMARALLTGAKSQTRRHVTSMWANLKMHHDMGTRCFLWVKEAWSAETWYDRHPAGSNVIQEYRQPRIWYNSGYLLESFGTITKFSPLDLDAQWSKGKKRHARFMPRWASRLTLEVTDVRLQKLQEITEEDALAEGCPGYAWHRHPALGICTDEGALPSEEFQSLWESIHGPEAWEENPEVLAINFICHHHNIDEFIKQKTAYPPVAPCPIPSTTPTLFPATGQTPTSHAQRPSNYSSLVNTTDNTSRIMKASTATETCIEARGAARPSGSTMIRRASSPCQT